MIPFPYVVDKEFARIYFDLLKDQWKSEEEILAFQTRKLKEIIRFAYSEVPYYRKVFDEVGVTPADFKDLADLAALPILTKDDIRENFDQLHSREYTKYAPSPGHTSGSTGTTVTFTLTHFVKHYEMAFGHRHWRAAGFGSRDRSVIIRGDVLTDDPRARAPFLKKAKELFLSSFHMSVESLPEYARMIAAFRPVAIRAYPSALKIVTRYFMEKGLPPIKGLKVILTSSESLLQSVREEAEEFWGVPVNDWYGNAERVAAIGQCEYGNYHVHEDYSFVEMIPTDSPERYRIVGTTYYNLAMPLIRYDMRDIVCIDSAVADQFCSCGRFFRVVSGIDGRIEGIVVTPDGRFVGRLDAAFKYSTGIELAQIIQKTIDSIEIRIVRGDSFSDDDLGKLTKELRLRLGESITINYEFVSDISRTAAGKLRFVISKLGNNYVLNP